MRQRNIANLSQMVSAIEKKALTLEVFVKGQSSLRVRVRLISKGKNNIRKY